VDAEKTGVEKRVVAMDIAEQAGRADQGNYWNQFYGRSGQVGAIWPSQFAAFVLGEIDRQEDLIDVGCGTGRDALFFASHGLKVVGLDASEAAIRICTSLQRDSGMKSVNFIHGSVDDADLLDQVSQYRTSRAPTVYARFFLHAISDEQEDRFLSFARSICLDGGMLAAEFRTVRDAGQTKVTPDHYRRFMEPVSFLEKAHRHGFATNYYVEGFGFAKYGADDAYVSRCILSRRAA
jgi:ubiquinone/menaquinone biosynthesis C-methylase UbiE